MYANRGEREGLSPWLFWPQSIPLFVPRADKVHLLGHVHSSPLHGPGRCEGEEQGSEKNCSLDVNKQVPNNETDIHWARHLLSLFHLLLTTSLWDRQCSCAHFVDEKIKAQRCEGACLHLGRSRLEYRTIWTQGPLSLLRTGLGMKSSIVVFTSTLLMLKNTSSWGLPWWSSG